MPWYVAVRHGDFKLIRYLQPGNPEELYNLQSDPQELTNLASLPEFAKQRAKLEQALSAELKRTEAGFLAAIPEPQR